MFNENKNSCAFKLAISNQHVAFYSLLLPADSYKGLIIQTLNIFIKRSFL